MTAAVLDEKASACEALGHYAANTGAAFMPYIEKSVEAIETMSNYFVDDVRKVAYHAMSGMVKATLKAFPAVDGTASPQVRAIVNKSMQLWLTAISEDDSKSGVAAALDASAEILKEVGLMHRLRLDLCGIHDNGCL